MNKSFKLNFITIAMAALLLSGCDDAETTIVEQDPIETVEETDDGYTIESMGRLAVLSADSSEAAIFDLDDGDLLDTFTLTHDDNTLDTSASYRFAVIANRTEDYVGFIDGGLFREDHVEHLHDFEQAPVMSDFELTDSRPTHVTAHDGQMAVFYDGDEDSGTFASVQVITDADITSENDELPGIVYDINMHGVAEARGEHLLSTIRRDDAETTSATTVLPDHVGVYHFHDDEYELEQTLDVNCPDLHGASQNHEFVVFGCTDGILVAEQDGDNYEASKMANISEVGSLRIGTIYGHEDSEVFVGIASTHGGPGTLFSINPEANVMEAIDWQPMTDASPIAYAFGFGGEHFLILDDLGYLTILSQHEHDGELELEFEGRIDISEEDVSTMHDGMSFSMTVAQNGQFAYVADPIAQHVLQIHIEDMEIEGDIELDFAPASITWLGIAEEADDHDHDH